MKKVVLFFAVSAAMALVSCNNSGCNNQAATCDGADSVAAVVTEEVAATVDSTVAVVDSAAAVAVDSAAAVVADAVEAAK